MSEFEGKKQKIESLANMILELKLDPTPESKKAIQSLQQQIDMIIKDEVR